MYDGGNYLNTNLGSSFNYTSGAVVTNSGFGSGGRYVTSQLAGFFAMGAELNGVSTFSITGNLGADGYGAVTAHTFTTTVNGVSYSCYLKRVNDGSYDPAIHQVFIVPTTSGVSHSYSTYTDNNLHTLSGLSSVPYMYYILFAGRTSSNPYAYSIPNSNVEDITTKFLETVADTGLFITNESAFGRCPEQDSLRVSYNTGSAFFNSGNSITVQMSDSNGSFSNATTVASWSTTAVTDTSKFEIPNVDPGSGYQIRLISSNPVDTSTSKYFGDVHSIPESPSWVFFSDTAICSSDSVSFYDTTSTSGGGIQDSVIQLLYSGDISTNYSSCGNQGKYSCSAPITVIWNDSIAQLPTSLRFDIYTRINCNQNDSLIFTLNGEYQGSDSLNYYDCSCSEQGSNKLMSIELDPQDLNSNGPDTLVLTFTSSNCVGVDTTTILDGAIARVAAYYGSTTVTQYSLASSFNTIIGEGDTFTTFVSSNTDYYYRSINNVTGCIGTDYEVQTIEVSDLNVSATLANDVSCNGGNEGAITASSTGGLGTVEYSVDGSTWQTSTSLTGLTAGTYVVYARDDEDCIDSTTAIMVDEPNLLVATAIVDDSVSCNGGKDGEATASATGGTTAYTYAWSGGGGSSATATGLTAGTYTVTVTDANSCTDTESVTITEPTAVVATIGTPTHVSCFGGNNGAATASATGGTGTITYAWSGGGTSATNSSLTAGAYTVTATDANSCTDTDTVTITEPTEVIALIDSFQSASCVDANDGFAFVSVTGGAAGYTYLWNNSTTTALNENLGVAEYTVVVTDANNCEDSDTIDIIFEDSIAPTVMVQNITAYLDASGSISITAGQIDNGSYDSCGIAQMIISDSVFSCDDTVNQVILTIIDVNGNFASDTATVTVTDTIPPSIECPSPIEICEGVLALDNATSTDNCSSSTMHINGPVDGDTLAAGSYSSEFIAMDIFGNESTCSVDITVNPFPVVELGNDSIFCDSIEFTLDAGNTGSSFDWSTGESSQTILVTDSGNYTVTVTDANGCESSSSIHVGLKVCVGIDEVGNPIYMTVYPNPTTNMVNIQIDGFANEVRYDILDINGKLVQSSNRNGVSASTVEVIDISSFSAGIYILSVKVNDKTYVQRISKL